MKMKRKGIILASAILGSVAVVSTGFAAWVITSPEVKAESVGNIQVETVSDERVQLGIQFKQSDNGNVSFGAPATQNAYAKKWLENQGGQAEDLDATFTVTAKTTQSSSNATGTISVNLAVMLSDGVDQPTYSDYADFDTKNKNTKTVANEISATNTLIVLPTFSTPYTLTEGSVEVPVTFDWGTAFNNDNPYDYYNTQEYSDTIANSALYNLQSLNSLLENAVFKITVTYTATA